MSGFTLIFCFKHFNSNKFFDSFLGKFNVCTGNLDKFLTKARSFILGFFFRLGSGYISAESSVVISIHPEIFQKRFFKRSS